jgi:hypothetical protein
VLLDLAVTVELQGHEPVRLPVSAVQKNAVLAALFPDLLHGLYITTMVKMCRGKMIRDELMVVASRGVSRQKVIHDTRGMHKSR